MLFGRIKDADSFRAAMARVSVRAQRLAAESHCPRVRAMARALAVALVAASSDDATAAEADARLRRLHRDLLSDDR